MKSTGSRLKDPPDLGAGVAFGAAIGGASTAIDFDLLAFASTASALALTSRAI